MIGGVELLYLVYQMSYSVAVWLRGGSAHLTVLIITLVAFVLGIIILTLLLFGLFGSKHFLLLPHLFCQALAILAFFLVAALCFAALSGGDPRILSVINVTDADQQLFHDSRGMVTPDQGRSDHRITTDLRPIIVFKFIINFSMGVLEIWWLVVVLKAYRFLKAKAEYKAVLQGQKGVIGSRMANATAVIPATNQYYYAANHAKAAAITSANAATLLSNTHHSNPPTITYSRTHVY